MEFSLSIFPVPFLFCQCLVLSVGTRTELHILDVDVQEIWTYSKRKMSMFLDMKLLLTVLHLFHCLFVLLKSVGMMTPRSAVDLFLITVDRTCN